MKRLFIGIIFFLALLLTACQGVDVSQISDEDMQRISDKLIVCNSPYIRFASECCLDQNNNSICDKDEGMPSGTTPPATTGDDSTPPTQDPEQPSGTSSPSLNKPKVELFVMSYCPYGIQMEKAYVQVVDLLQNKADFKVRWVSYSMHDLQEVQENLRQYCIQKEQPSRYNAYLRCFVENTNPIVCADDANVDLNSNLATCIESTDEQYAIIASYNDKTTWISGRFPPFNIDKALNTQYGVQGSPTLVINGQQVSVQRSAEGIKTAVCNAFNTNKPAECSQTLSTIIEQPGPGQIGTTGGDTGSDTGCGAPTIETCTDRIKNQDETDADCGGNKCLLCKTGKACLINDDCASKYCHNSICTIKPTPTVNVDLADYPDYFFTEDGQFNTKIVVGSNNAPTSDVMSAVDIAASLQAKAVSHDPVNIPSECPSGDCSGGTVNPIAVGLAVQDTAVTDPTSANYILIGNLCTNSALRKLFEYTAEYEAASNKCDLDIGPGQARIILLQHDDYIQLAIIGGDAQTVVAAAYVVANWQDYAASFKGTRLKIVAPDMGNIVVQSIG